MTETVISLRLFYPMLFLTIGVVLVLLICSVKTILINFKDKDSQDFQFKTHCEEHTDTTGKMKGMHNEVVEHALPKEYESELHTLEVMVRELNDKVNYLYEEFLKLKNERKL